MKPNPISVNHPYAATSDILILFVALFIQIVAPYSLPRLDGLELGGLGDGVLVSGALAAGLLYSGCKAGCPEEACVSRGDAPGGCIRMSGGGAVRGWVSWSTVECSYSRMSGGGPVRGW